MATQFFLFLGIKHLCDPSLELSDWGGSTAGHYVIDFIEKWKTMSSDYLYFSSVPSFTPSSFICSWGVTAYVTEVNS